MKKRQATRLPLYFHNNMKNLRKGFILIENIVIMVLLAVLVVGSLNLHPAVSGFVTRQEQRLIAGNLIYSQIEDLRRIAHSVSFNDLSLTNGQHAAPTAGVLVPPGFNLTYAVVDNTWPVNPPPPVHVDFKRITVTCATPFGFFTATLTGDVTP